MESLRSSDGSCVGASSCDFHPADTADLLTAPSPSPSPSPSRSPLPSPSLLTLALRSHRCDSGVGVGVGNTCPDKNHGNGTSGHRSLDVFCASQSGSAFDKNSSNSSSISSTSTSHITTSTTSATPVANLHLPVVPSTLQPPAYDPFEMKPIPLDTASMTETEAEADDDDNDDDSTAAQASYRLCHIQSVLPDFLYIGGAVAAKDRQTLRQLAITTIVNVTLTVLDHEHQLEGSGNHLRCYRVPVEDEDDEDILSYLPEVTDFIFSLRPPKRPITTGNNVTSTAIHPSTKCPHQPAIVSSTISTPIECDSSTSTTAATATTSRSDRAPPRVRPRRHRVLVHCRGGISRSATVVCAYLIRFYGLSVEKALVYLRRCRPGVQPNPGFIRQLGQFQDLVQRAANGDPTTAMTVPAVPEMLPAMVAEKEDEEEEDSSFTCTKPVTSKR